MTWFEAIVESIKFVLAELFAPIFDWLVDAFSDAIFAFMVIFIPCFIFTVACFFLGINPVGLLI